MRTGFKTWDGPASLLAVRLMHRSAAVRAIFVVLGAPRIGVQVLCLPLLCSPLNP
jgi:hypothetical protein